ncbi:ParB N-terminal domain-containing protein [Acaryochloris marina NIES-2412]|uniref:hypothetical protein n=1 Tax=Acaryochloris marina TaxID=155978 RepID=UPI004059B5E4
MSSVICLEISILRRDGGLQCRSSLKKDSVATYAAAMERGEYFPPVIAFNDGQEIWLADGYHRLAAAECIGQKTFSVDLRSGSLRDAILYVTSIKSNKLQGLPHTLGDRYRVVERLLRDHVWSRCSDDQIADHCGVSRQCVHRIRQECTLRY